MSVPATVQGRPNVPVATVPELRVWFRQRIREQSPAAEVRWVLPLRRVTFPTGLRGIVGQAEVSAPGFAPRRMVVTADAFGKAAR